MRRDISSTEIESMNPKRLPNEHLAASPDETGRAVNLRTYAMRHRPCRTSSAIEHGHEYPTRWGWDGHLHRLADGPSPKE